MTKTIRLRLVVRSVRKRVNQATPGEERRGRSSLLPGAEPEGRGEEAGNVHGFSTVRSAFVYRDGATPCLPIRAFRGPRGPVRVRKGVGGGSWGEVHGGDAR